MCSLCVCQDAFDLVDEKFRTPLSADPADDDDMEDDLEDDLEDDPDLEQSLQRALQHSNIDVFLSALYECMLLQITVKQDLNDEDYVDYSAIP